MIEIENRIKEQVEFVSQYVGNCDDWVTIKKEILKGLPPNLRKKFSTRDPITKEQWLSDFDKSVINYYKEKTDIVLVLRSLEERRGVNGVV